MVSHMEIKINEFVHSRCERDGPNWSKRWLFLSFWLFQDLDSSLETLTAAFERATAEKLRFQEEVNRTNKTIELANRLVKGLEVSKASLAAEAETTVATQTAAPLPAAALAAEVARVAAAAEVV